MKIGSLITKLPTILKMIGMGKVDIKEEMNSIPNTLVNMIIKEEANINEGLTTSVLAIKNPNNELILIPVGFSVTEDSAVISQQLEATNITQLVQEADLTKLGDLLDDEESQLTFIEKLKAAKIS